VVKHLLGQAGSSPAVHYTGVTWVTLRAEIAVPPNQHVIYCSCSPHVDSVNQGDMLYVSDLDTVVLFCNDSGGQFGPGPQTRVFQPEYVSGLLHFGRSLRFPFPFLQWRVTIADLCTSFTAFTSDEPLRWGEYLQEYTPRSSWTVGLSPLSLESRSRHRGIRKSNTRRMRSPGKISLEMSWCMPDVLGICLHPNQKSTSYHNRKSRSETSSIVMPPDFLCSFRSSGSKSSSATTFSSGAVAASRFNPTAQVAVTADTMRDVWSDLTMTREP